MKILHGFTGSVASKLADKFNLFYEEKEFEVKYVSTNSAMNFMDSYLCGKKTFHTVLEDKEEWYNYKENNTVLHIDLVKWADVFVIAPCSANTLAKLANGICDNLLTCVARAWDFNKKIIVAASMNSRMFEHKVTRLHLDLLKSWGYTIVEPVEKQLFCGDFGIGAMAEIENIIEKVNE